MRRIVWLPVLAFMLSAVMFAQGQRLYYEELQQFLPDITLNGFERDSPMGIDSIGNELVWSEASVSYFQLQSPGDEADSLDLSGSITVTILDYGPAANAARVFTPLSQTFDSQNDAGYEKSVKINGKYPGIESLSNAFGFTHSMIRFGISSRFLVTVSGHEIEHISTLYKMVEALDLARLESVL